MRLALAFVLLPSLATAQDVPSLQRPNPALPITASAAVLQGRLGGPGGAFAAAQLALLGRDDTLRAATRDADPLRRLDAAYGLSGLDPLEDRLALAALLGDPDPRVLDEAETALIRIGLGSADALHATALHGGQAAGSAAIDLLLRFEDWHRVRDVAMTPGAAGRRRAIEFMSVPTPEGLPVAEAATLDPRPDVRRSAVGWILRHDRDRIAAESVARLLRSPSPAVRATVAGAVGEEYGSWHDPLLVTLAQDPSPTVRRGVADGAANRLGQADRPVMRAVLMRLVDDPDPTVSDAAFAQLADDAIGQYPPHEHDSRASPEATVRFRDGLLRRLHGPEAFRAALLLADLHDPHAYPFLAPVAFGGTGATMERLAAIRRLGRAGDRRATPGLLRLTRSPDGNDPNAAYAALADLRDPASVASLLATVRREPTGWGPSAAHAIAAVGDRSAAPALLAVARSLPPGADANYFEPLAKLGGPGVREYLLDRLEHGLELTVLQAARALTVLHDRASIPDLERIAGGTGPRAEQAKRVLTTLRG